MELNPPPSRQEKFEVSIISNDDDAIFINLEPRIGSNEPPVGEPPGGVPPGGVPPGGEPPGGEPQGGEARSGEPPGEGDSRDGDHVRIYRSSFAYGVNASVLACERADKFPFQRHRSFEMRIRREATRFVFSVDGRPFHTEPYPSWMPHNIDAVLVQGDQVQGPVFLVRNPRHHRSPIKIFKEKQQVISVFFEFHQTDVDEEDLIPENYTRQVTSFDYGTNGDGYEFRSRFISKLVHPSRSWNIQVHGIIPGYTLPLRQRIEHQFVLEDRSGDPVFMVSYRCGPEEDAQPFSYTMGWNEDGAFMPETHRLTSCPFVPDSEFILAIQRYVGDVDALQYSLSVGPRVTSRHLFFNRTPFPDRTIDRIIASGRMGVYRIAYVNAVSSV